METKLIIKNKTDKEIKIELFNYRSLFNFYDTVKDDLSDVDIEIYHRHDTDAYSFAKNEWIKSDDSYYSFVFKTSIHPQSIRIEGTTSNRQLYFWNYDIMGVKTPLLPKFTPDCITSKYVKNIADEKELFNIGNQTTIDLYLFKKDVFEIIFITEKIANTPPVGFKSPSLSKK